MEDKRRPISVEEHKKIMLEILLYFDKFCKEHYIRKEPAAKVQTPLKFIRA